MGDKPIIRRRMSALRSRLSPTQQTDAAAALTQKTQKHPVFLHARHIAGYFAMNGEIDPMPLLRYAAKRGKRVYLPVLDHERMRFKRFVPGVTPLRRNRYGIPEPCGRGHQTLSPEKLNLVMLPLLAFDSQGRRLGMGGGFYDRIR